MERTRLVLPLLACLFSQHLLAAGKKTTTDTPPAPAVSLRDQAINEAFTQGVQTHRATDAGVEGSGVLSLKDPGLEPGNPNWKWLIGLRLQSYAPSGTATMANGQEFDLGTVGSTTYPIAELGLLRELGSRGDFSFRAGLRADIGYTSQTTDVYFPTQVKAENTRLSTGLAALNLTLGTRWARLPSLELEAGLGQGLLSTSQSSPDSMVAFSKQTGFRSYSLGALWWLKPEWALEIQQAQRTLTTSENIKLQAGNFSVGTRVMW